MKPSIDLQYLAMSAERLAERARQARASRPDLNISELCTCASYGPYDRVQAYPASVLEREHSRLLHAANDVVADLRGFEARLVPGRVAHEQHTVFAERARSLGIYLSSALQLGAEDKYISAYAVLRAGLEHI